MPEPGERQKEGRDMTAMAHEPLTQEEVLLDGFLALGFELDTADFL